MNDFGATDGTGQQIHKHIEKANQGRPKQRYREIERERERRETEEHFSNPIFDLHGKSELLLLLTQNRSNYFSRRRLSVRPMVALQTS